MNETFIPTYYPTASYTNEQLTVVDRQWFKDMTSIRVGPARLRQVRMKTGKLNLDTSKITRYSNYRRLFLHE